MLETILDSEILIDFYDSKPVDPLHGTIEEYAEWFSLLSFLKSGTNLKLIKNGIFDGQKEKTRILTALASGRGDTKIKIEKSFNWPHKNKLPKETFPGSFYCLNQQDETKRLQLTTRNGLLFAFMNNYREQWRKLSISGKHHLTYHVRKGVDGENSLKKWDTLSQHILPFTDVIICDKYIHQKDCRDNNLLELIKLLDNHSFTKYNLLIITNKDKISLDEFEDYLKEKIDKYKLKANLGIVLSRKEHDRCIIMNYIRIESGDSFNFFNSAGAVITNGTKLKLFPHCYSENFDDTKITLTAIRDIVQNERHDYRGNITNDLFKYCDT